MNLSGPFIRRPIGTALLAIGLFMVGLICYLRLGVSALPNIEIPVIFVHASQSGADAATMASTVTAPLERHLGQLPGIDRMRSSSSEGSSLVFMIFQSGHNIDSAALDVQTAINSAQADLPSGMGSPMYQKANPNDDPVIAIALTSQTQSADELYNVADSLLAQRIRQISGVASVDIAGASTPAVRVDVNLRLMNALGLTADDLRNAVRAANVTSPTGFLSDGNTTTAIIANDSVARAADFADLVVKTQGDGRVIRLKDIANVYDGQQDAYQAAWFDHKPAVVMYVFTRAGANIVETVDRVKAQIPTLRDYLQPGTTMTPYFDRTPTIRSSLHEVQITLLISLAMVVLTMALFLRRLAPTLIAAVTVPLSLAGAALVMYVMGFTLNNLSLLALVIAIGFVVDDAIVVIENIMRHLDEGMPRMQAALTGAREIGFTIVSITASLVAVFIPLLFASGMMGAFFREFTVTLVAAIVVSMIVSLTLTPALCSRFLSAHDHSAPPSRFGRWLDAGHERMLRVYTVFLDFSLRHALLLSLTPLILIGATVFLFGAVKKGAFPPQDTGLIWGRANSSATVSFEDMVARQRRITDMLMADPAVKTVGVRLGSGRQGSSAQFNIELKSRSDGRRETTAHALARLSAKADRYPDLQLRLRAIQDLPSNDGGGSSQGAQYRISLQGNDLASLQEWLPKLQAELKKNPSCAMSVPTWTTPACARTSRSTAPRPHAWHHRGCHRRCAVRCVRPAPDLHHLFGHQPVQRGGQRPALADRHPRRAGRGVRACAQWRHGADHRGGHADARPAPSQITHENQYTTMDLSYNLAPNVSMGEAKAIIDATVAGMRMPGDIRLADDAGFGFNSDPSDMLILVFAAILTVYLVLGMLYESLIHPITILSTLPAAGGVHCSRCSAPTPSCR